MKFEMVYPSKKQTEQAKERGVDLLHELCEIFKDEVVNRLAYGTGRTIGFSIDKRQLMELSRYGVDLPTKLCETYINEVHRAWDKEMMEDADEVNIPEESLTPETIYNALVDFINEHPNQRKIVVSPRIGTEIQEIDGWNPVLNNDEYPGRTYLLGRLVICSDTVEVWVDPHIRWDDAKIKFIRPENEEQ